MRVGPERGDLARHVAVVLDRHRDAEQRAAVATAAAPVGLVGLDQGTLGDDDAEGVEPRVEPADPLEVELGELTRGQLTCGDQLGLAGEPGEGDGIGGGRHGAEATSGPLLGSSGRPWPTRARPSRSSAASSAAARAPTPSGRAAGWLHDDLRARGHEAWVETHWVRPQWALSLALHAALGVIASVTAIYAPAVGLGLALLAAVSLGVEASGRTGPLRLAFPRRATQNVLTVPAHARPLTLLICARYDAGRGGALAGDRCRRWAARARRLLGGHTPGPRAWLALACAAVAACAAGRLVGADGLALGIAQFVPTVALSGRPGRRRRCRRLAADPGRQRRRQRRGGRARPARRARAPATRAPLSRPAALRSRRRRPAGAARAPAPRAPRPRRHSPARAHRLRRRHAPPSTAAARPPPAAGDPPARGRRRLPGRCGHRPARPPGR